MVDVQDVGGIHYALQVRSGNGKSLGNASGGDDEVVGGVSLAVTFNGVVVCKGGKAFNDINLRHLHHLRYALTQSVDNIVLALHNLVEIEREGEVVNAELLGVLELAHHLSVFHEAFGGNTACVEACATQFRTFEKGY